MSATWAGVGVIGLGARNKELRRSGPPGRGGEEWADFVQRAGANPLARSVKQADLEDNLAQRQTFGEDGTKYQEGLALLRDTLR